MIDATPLKRAVGVEQSLSVSPVVRVINDTKYTICCGPSWLGFSWKTTRNRVEEVDVELTEVTVDHFPARLTNGLPLKVGQYGLCSQRFPGPNFQLRCNKV